MGRLVTVGSEVEGTRKLIVGIEVFVFCEVVVGPTVGTAVGATVGNTVPPGTTGAGVGLGLGGEVGEWVEGAGVGCLVGFFVFGGLALRQSFPFLPFLH